MALLQLARGLWTKFAKTESPFEAINGMEENLRLIDDHLGLYTVLPPQPPGTPFPANPVNGDGQIYTDGTYAVYNAEKWKQYNPRRGVNALEPDGTRWGNTGTGWEKNSLEKRLGAAEGAGIVGSQYAISGAPVFTLEDFFKSSKINFRAVGGDPAAADNTAALNRARALSTLTGLGIYAPAGVYKFTGVSSLASDLKIEGDGDATVFDFTGVTGGYAIEALGAATALPALSGTQAAGATSLLFASAPGLTAGDVFIIHNPADYSWSGHRNYYNAGEWCEVISVTGSTVTLKSPLYDTYAAAAVNVYKVTGQKVDCRNFSVRGTAGLTGIFRPFFCISPNFYNIKGDHAGQSIIYFDRCYSPISEKPRLKNIGAGLGTDYGIVIGNSQHARVIGGDIYGRRHAVATGGGAGTGAVPNRDCIISASVLRNDRSTGLGSANFHGNTEFSKYVDCVIYNGAILAGKDNFVEGGVVCGSSIGYAVYISEVKGGRLGVRGAEIQVRVNPQVSGVGIIDVGGNSVSAINASTTLDTTIVAEDIALTGENITSLTSLVLFKNRGTTSKVNFKIDGVTGYVNSPMILLYTENASGTAASDFIVIDKITGFPAGTFLHYAASTGVYVNFPHRCQKQSGAISLSTAVGSHIVVDTAKPFRYKYPRAPSGQTTSVGGYAGNRMAYAGFTSLTASGYTVQIESGDGTDWTTAIARTVNWTASIDEV